MDFNINWLKPDYLILYEPPQSLHYFWGKAFNGESCSPPPPQVLMKSISYCKWTLPLWLSKIQFLTTFTPSRNSDVCEKVYRKILCAKIVWTSEIYLGKEADFDFCIQIYLLKTQPKPIVKSVVNIVSPLPFKWRELNWIESKPLVKILGLKWKSSFNTPSLICLLLDWAFCYQRTSVKGVLS